MIHELFVQIEHGLYTARSIEIVPRDGPPIFRLMNSRGGPPMLELYVDEI